MQKEDPSFWFAVFERLASSALLILAVWGAAGGLTNALVVRASVRETIRLLVLGAIIAAGMGSLSMAMLVSFLDLPPEAIPAAGASSSAAYVFGTFGSAIVEVILGRIRAPHKEDRPDD
jgi:hypothetical protein